MSETKPKRHRRTEDELLRDLEAKLAQLKQRAEQRKQRESPVAKEAAKLVKAARKFAQLAQDNQRTDLSLSAQAFAAGLERAASQAPHEDKPRRRETDAEQA